MDGGGMKGLATVQMLKQIEQGTGKRIHEMFDLICGTSTGGMLAMALGIKRMNLDQCEEIYTKLGKLVFAEPVPKDESATWKEKIDQLFKSSSQSFRVVVHGSKHSADQFERLLKEMCADDDGDLLIESAVKGIPKVFVVSTLVSAMPAQPYLFRNYQYPPGTLEVSPGMAESPSIGAVGTAVSGAPVGIKRGAFMGSCKHHNLNVLTVDNNMLVSVPVELRQCVLLEELSLEHNKLVRPLLDFRSVPKLRVLRLFGNPLEFLPEILPLHNLRHLTLANIRIDALESLKSVTVQIEVMEDNQEIGAYMFRRTVPAFHMSPEDVRWMVGAWRERIIVCSGKYGLVHGLIKAFVDSGAKAVISSSAEPPDSQAIVYHGMDVNGSLENGKFVIGDDEADESEPEPVSPISDWEDSDAEKNGEGNKDIDDEEYLAQFICLLYDKLFREGVTVDTALQQALRAHPRLKYTCHLPNVL
uniref:Uncharacterized protein n=1 Tax=Avena sativa TaxID=4498 RepID=A0ACD5U782_AVESA